MKYFYTAVMLILFAHVSQAQNPDYENQWKTVEELELKGLPKSALKIVEDISKQAKKDNKQVIKVFHLCRV